MSKTVLTVGKISRVHDDEENTVTLEQKTLIGDRVQLLTVIVKPSDLRANLLGAGRWLDRVVASAP